MSLVWGEDSQSLANSWLSWQLLSNHIEVIIAEKESWMEVINAGKRKRAHFQVISFGCSSVCYF
jgi:hypothetical protein